MPRDTAIPYRYCDNNAINQLDLYGLWKWQNGKRQGVARATIIAENGDTKYTLAEKIHLWEHESRYWLQEADGSPVKPSDTIKPGCAYTVPNVFVVAVGEQGRTAEGWSLIYANQARARAVEKGFLVKFFVYSGKAFTQSDLSAAFSDNWGFALYGHGYVYPDALHGAFIISKNGHPAPWNGDKWSIFVSNEAGGLYKRGVVIAKMCSAIYGGWSNLVSPNGREYIATGVFHAATAGLNHGNAVNGIE